MDSIDPLLLGFLPKDVRNMFFPYASVQLGSLLINLILGFALASLIGYHFRRYASAFCNRQDFSRLFPLLMLTVILIITVVKASLALALGLVGALSIVRFRTPIKEPEELVYLFLNIGVAVALGAGQTLAAVIACIITLLLVTIAKRHQSKISEEQGLFLSLQYNASEAQNVPITQLKELLSSKGNGLDLRRFDTQDDMFSATFFITAYQSQHLDGMLSQLRQQFPGIQVSMLEQHNISGV